MCVWLLQVHKVCGHPSREREQVSSVQDSRDSIPLKAVGRNTEDTLSNWRKWVWKPHQHTVHVLIHRQSSGRSEACFLFDLFFMVLIPYNLPYTYIIPYKLDFVHTWCIITFYILIYFDWSLFCIIVFLKTCFNNNNNTNNIININTQREKHKMFSKINTI